MKAVFHSSVSLQTRHPVHPGFTLPRETGQVPRRLVIAVVIGPRDRGSGGWKLPFLVSNWRRRVVASMLTVMLPLTTAVVFFLIC